MTGNKNKSIGLKDKSNADGTTEDGGKDTGQADAGHWSSAVLQRWRGGWGGRRSTVATVRGSWIDDDDGGEGVDRAVGLGDDANGGRGRRGARPGGGWRLGGGWPGGL